MSTERIEVVAKSTSIVLVAVALCSLLLAAYTFTQPNTLSLNNSQVGAGSMTLDRRAP